MAIDSNKSFEVSEHGITIDSGTGIWIGGGNSIPTHNAPEGSQYFRTNPIEHYVQESPGNTNNWVLVEVEGGADEFAYTKQMGNNAQVNSGKWLEFHHNIFSNDSPFYPPKSVKLKAVSAAFVNSETVTFGVYKNGTQIDTLVITASNNGTKANLSHSLLTTDGVSVKVESGSAHKPVFNLFFG